MDRGFRGTLAIAVTIQAGTEAELHRAAGLARVKVDEAMREAGVYVASLGPTVSLQTAPESDFDAQARLAGQPSGQLDGPRDVQPEDRAAGQALTAGQQ